MNCLILAAGYATRLYPLTENFPKPLLKVGEKTIIDWLVDDLAADGRIDSFTVVTNHRFAPLFAEWAGGKDCRVRIADDGTSTNGTRLGAVRDIEFAMKTEEDPFDGTLVLAGDNVLDFSLSRFLDFCAEKRSSCVMRYFEQDTATLSKRGVLELSDDGSGLVVSMEEKPKNPRTNWCCPPFYYFTRDDAGMIGRAVAEGCGTDAPGSFIGWLCRHSPVYAMEMPGKRYDIGTLESYEYVKSIYKGIV